MGSGVRRLQRSARIAASLLLLAGLLTTVVIATPEVAGANLAPAMNRTVLLVHGFSLNSSTDCNGTWSQDISWFKSEGFTGPFVKIGYYTGDSNCDINLHSYGSYGDQDSWKSIAAAFSHYVHDTYTSK